MEILLETTKWDVEYNVPSHTYALNGAGKCVAYRNAVTGEINVFSKPMSFEKRKRSFKKVSDTGLEAVC